MSRINSVGSHLADLALWRAADGTITMQVTHMDPRLIETTGDEVAERMTIIAGWALEGAANMEVEFDG